MNVRVCAPHKVSFNFGGTQYQHDAIGGSPTTGEFEATAQSANNQNPPPGSHSAETNVDVHQIQPNNLPQHHSNNNNNNNNSNNSNSNINNNTNSSNSINGSSNNGSVGTHQRISWMSSREEGSGVRVF